MGLQHRRRSVGEELHKTKIQDKKIQAQRIQDDLRAQQQGRAATQRTTPNTDGAAHPARSRPRADGLLRPDGCRRPLPERLRVDTHGQCAHRPLFTQKCGLQIHQGGGSDDV